MRALRIAVALVAIASAATAAWYDDYNAGIAAARAGDWRAVVEKMTTAIAGQPQESDHRRTYGAIFLNYHPYYYRGVAYANLGKYDEAAADFARATGIGELDLGPIDTWIARTKRSVTPAPMPATPMPMPGTPRPAPPPVTSPVVVAPSTPKHPPKSSPPPPVATQTTSVPIAAAPVPAAFPVDDLLTRSGSIAFNTPPSMTVGEGAVIQLLLDPRRAPEVLKRELTEPGRTETATIRISDTIEAKLSGAGFDIHAITPEVQPISGLDRTEWRWQVTAREDGTQRLFLTINAQVGAGATRRTIRTYDRAIDVHVSPRTLALRYGAAGSAIALVAVAVLLMRRRSAPRDTSNDRTAIQERTPAHGATFEPGQVVGGRYKILRFVGRGGMGAVYAAEDGEFGNEVVAIKTILASTNADRALARLRREIQVARRVAHPNVCRMFDVGYHEGTLFVTMEYIDGRTLSEIVRERGRLQPHEAAPIIAGIAAALDATHRAGLIHRDVKSANVMIANSDGRAILMDFGLARTEREESITQTGAIVGSPMYMAPEQVQDGPLSPATDIYAFGVVIYEMVTGHLPFEGDSAMSVLARRMREAPQPPSRFVPDLDSRWEQAILKCLEADPARRYQNAMDVRQAFRTDTTTEAV